jgi:uncharacterized membrane protein YcaP (DUF421 family)
MGSIKSITLAKETCGKPVVIINNGILIKADERAAFYFR